MYKERKILAVIPARGGSKGIPRKNIVSLGGKPLISYTIEAASESKYIDRVIVSTEDEEIATISRKCGAEVPFLRPQALATDTAPSIIVIPHTLQMLKKQMNYQPDIVVYLEPTYPFRVAKQIDDAIEKIDDYDSIISIREVEEHPYLMLTRDEENIIRPYIKLQNRPFRRQEYPLVYKLEGAFYIVRTDHYKKKTNKNSIFPDFDERVYGVLIDKFSSIDIDEPSDLELAEYYLSHEHINQ